MRMRTIAVPTSQLAPIQALSTLNTRAVIVRQSQEIAVSHSARCSRGLTRYAGSMKRSSASSTSRLIPCIYSASTRRDHGNNPWLRSTRPGTLSRSFMTSCARQTWTGSLSSSSVSKIDDCSCIPFYSNTLEAACSMSHSRLPRGAADTESRRSSTLTGCPSLGEHSRVPLEST